MCTKNPLDTEKYRLGCGSQTFHISGPEPRITQPHVLALKSSTGFREKGGDLTFQNTARTEPTFLESFRDFTCPLNSPFSLVRRIVNRFQPDFVLTWITTAPRSLVGVRPQRLTPFFVEKATNGNLNAASEGLGKSSSGTSPRK